MEDMVVYDEPHDCPYLPGRVARTPLRVTSAAFTPEIFDRFLAEGDRRTGYFLYRNECADCVACEPIRIPVREFEMTRNRRRVLNRGDRLIETQVIQPMVDAAHVSLFNKHRNLRGLNHDRSDTSVAGYRSFLVDTCCDTIEFSYRLEGRLVGAAIADRGKTSMSAVYSFFDPDEAKLSLGVYSVLKQIEFCQTTGIDLLYLGFYVADSPHMKYKARYTPHERLIDGEWISFS